MRSAVSTAVVFFCLPFCIAAQKAPAPSDLQKAVDEFKIQTAALGARADTAHPTGPTKPPPAAWHGRLFDNVRNDLFDAVPHEIAQRGDTKSLLRRNQFGLNLSGPLSIPKLYRAQRTFLSLSYEGVRERISRSFLRTIPTAAERAGDFSATVDYAGNPLPVHDPKTTRLNPAYDPAQPVSLNNLQYVRDPFPNNRIPASRLDPAGMKAAAFYPAPNSNAGPFFRNNYFAVSPETNIADGLLIKVDHTLNGKQRLAGSLSVSNGLLGTAALLPNAGDPNPSDRIFTSRKISLTHTLALSAHTVNTFTVDGSTDLSNGQSKQAAAPLSIPGAAGGVFPVFQVAPYVPLGHPFPVTRDTVNHFGLTESLATRRGKHNLRLSANWSPQQVNTFRSRYPNGSFRFGPGFTSLPGIVGTGSAFASFLLGSAEFAEQTLMTSPSYFRRSGGALSLQDQFDVRRGLTVSWGVNLNLSGPRVEKYDRQSTIDPRTGQLAAANRNGYGRGFQPFRARLEPNLGIAWMPTEHGGTVVRLGLARSYARIPVPFGQWGTQGFNTVLDFASPNAQLQPAVQLSDGLPAPPHSMPDLRPDAANGTVADLMDATPRQPVYTSASLAVEQELPGSTMLTLGAYHSTGHNMLAGNASADPNAIDPSNLSYRDLLNDTGFRQSLRPYPQYLGFELNGLYPIARYQRDATYVQLEKRSSNGLTLRGSYEFSKQMDDYSGPWGIQDFFHRQNDWSLTAGSDPHRFSLTYLYELPIGENKMFFSFSDWRRYLVDGWSLSGTTGVSSGEPLAPRPEFNNTGGVISTLNVNVAPGIDPHVAHPGPGLWFNPAAFSQPADFSLGNASRTIGGVLTPGNQNHDVALMKRVALDSERAVEFQASAFNFLNHANWNDPDTIIGPADAPNVNAGKIIGSTGGRVIQISMRFSF